MSALRRSIDDFATAGNANATYYHSQPRLTIALAMLGPSSEAAAQAARLGAARSPARKFFDTGWKMARAGVAACNDHVNQAISITKAMAEEAKGNGQFAVEVMSLQLAVQFGAGEVEQRLRELETIVDGPRVGIAVRFATSMRTRRCGPLGRSVP